ncbi:GD25752 [Drosophila simulans]|nr:GD25752 [Drosophila simulans]
MALSDIDLATLHENRLEQRWHYGLPNSHHIYHQHHQDGFSAMTRLCLERNLQRKVQPDLNGNCLARGRSRQNANAIDSSSGGGQRRRSGTWP